ncbi:hypothetical protein ENSA5_45860 [Enhygromyxa salina]|uniref:Uncharacterized protein n=1 Tax=Enhygromyxa salina TaxID=215803 RepID=A0A2S9XJI2_9BACT|nr:hypothetical protein [Enhygromyxa salina]PRP93025.1 hypothetical protein ENSA5_45860 [Enhygromyxa salina]
MSKAAELIAGLEFDTQFDSAGSFSLDRDKAREKMRQFQLADPHRYVLLLVEAASLSGATTIVFDIDSDDMRMRFDAALSYADLDELYTSLFVDRSTVEIRARRELALACNAVMALNPRWARIESFARGEDGQLHGVAATLRPEADDEITRLEQPTASPPQGMADAWTTIHVKDRFRPGLLVRFIHDVRGSIPEEVLIRERCAWASLSITLDEAEVSRGLPLAPVAGVRFETEHLRGVAGIEVDDGRRDRSAMVLVSNGVEIATHELVDSVQGLWFWVDSSRFRKDVSQGDIVRSDPAYEDTLEAVGRARDKVLERLVEQWAAGEFSEHGRPTADEVFDLLRGCFIRWADASWLGANAGPLGRVGALPLWRTVDGQWLSPRALAEQADPERGIMYSRRDFDGVVPLGWGPVIHVVDGLAELEAIRHVYPGAKDVSATLEREVPWELARRAWRARPHEIELPRSVLRYPMAFEQGEYRGRVALRPGKLSNLRVVVDGCLLMEVELDLGFIGLSAVITGPLEPARDYTRVRRDRSFATALMLVLAQLPRLVEAWASDEFAGDVVQRCLVALTQPMFASRWLEQFGYKTYAARQLVARLGAPPLVPKLGLTPGQPLGAVARAISFTTVDARLVTLAELDHDRREREREKGKILVVDRSAPSSEAVAELLVHAAPADLRLLEALFGASLIHDDTAAYVRELGRRSFEAKPRRGPSPPQATWTASVELDLSPARGGGKIRGHVGVGASQVRDWRPDDPRRVTIEVFTEGRQLCVTEERCWVPGAEAELAWDGAPVNANWTGLGGSSAPLREAVDAGLSSIIRGLAEAAVAESRRPNDDARRLLWLAMVAPFVSVEHVEAWRVLRKHHADDHAGAVEAYFGVMELFPVVPLDELREAITLLIQEDRLPTQAELLSVLGRTSAPPGGGRGFHREILASYGLLESVPLIPLVSGQAIDLVSLTRVFEATGEIAHVEDPALRWDGDERVIVRADEIDQVGLIRLFGRDAFTEVSGWIHERRHQQQFEARAPLEQIRVPDHTRLVGVEFERDDFEGELAVPGWTAGGGRTMKITLCHDRRIVQEIELRGWLPVVGIVDDPHAELSADYSEVETDGPRMAALRKVLSEVLSDQLLPALAERFGSLEPRERSLARTWIAADWRRSGLHAGQHPSRLSEVGERFARLKLFRDVDGTARSLIELIDRNRAQGCLWYVERDPGHGVEPPFAIVETRGPERELLADLFPKLEDFSQRWRARADGEQRKRAAPALPPTSAPKQALSVAPVSHHDMEGELWLPDRSPFDSGVILGAAGKVVEVIDPVSVLGAQGVIGGALEADDGFERVELTGAARRYLAVRVISLYSELLKRHRRELARPDTVDFVDPELARRRAVRFELLRAAAVALGQARRRGETFDAILGNLERGLNAQPLLRLATGRLISVSVARKARPQELAYLDIWDPNAPMLDASERARLLLDDAGEGVAKVEPTADPDPASEPDPEPTDLAAAVTAMDKPPLDTDEELGPLELSPLQLEPPEELAPEPQPEPQPDLVGELLERVREELRLLRERHQVVLAEGRLDRIDAKEGRGRELVSINGRVIFDSAHPRFVRALDDPDPIWVSFLASVAYTALNRWLEEITDAHELLFHAGHAEHLLSGLLDPEPPLGG